jgi:hypothetical protein
MRARSCMSGALPDEYERRSGVWEVLGEEAAFLCGCGDGGGAFFRELDYGLRVGGGVGFRSGCGVVGELAGGGFGCGAGVVGDVEFLVV